MPTLPALSRSFRHAVVFDPDRERETTVSVNVSIVRPEPEGGHGLGFAFSATRDLSLELEDAICERTRREMLKRIQQVAGAMPKDGLLVKVSLELPSAWGRFEGSLPELVAKFGALSVELSLSSGSIHS